MITTEVFEAFEPRAYLNEYYSKVGPENQGLLEFFSEAYEGIDESSLILEFGGGPTVYQLITAARKAREIHFSDYLSGNMQEVDLWRGHSRDAFDWNPFIQKALKLEGLSGVTLNDVEARASLMRAKMTKLIPGDAFKEDPLGLASQGQYDVVSTNFVAESITTSKEDWYQIMKNICSLLRREGGLIMTAIKEAEYYLIGNKRFPAVSIDEGDLVGALRDLGFRNFLLKSIPAETVGRVGGHKGYNGMIFIRALR